MFSQKSNNTFKLPPVFRCLRLGVRALISLTLLVHLNSGIKENRGCKEPNIEPTNLCAEIIVLQKIEVAYSYRDMKPCNCPIRMCITPSIT